MRIAVDTMGGDLGSQIPIQGAVRALDKRDNLQIVLLGPGEQLERQIREIVGNRPEIHHRIQVVHAPETIGMDESPVEAVRKKKNATVSMGSMGKEN